MTEVKIAFENWYEVMKNRYKDIKKEEVYLIWLDGYSIAAVTIIEKLKEEGMKKSSSKSSKKKVKKNENK